MAIALNNLWLPQTKINPHAKLRLFCFPYAGGTTYIYSQWCKFLPNSVEICPVELPGRRKRFQESPYRRLDALLADLSDVLLPYLDKPFAFFGHSMGGLVSFELTRLLRREYYISPVHLFISACRATQLPPSKPPIHNLDEQAFKGEIIRLGGTPQAVLENEEMMELILPTLRADFALIETHIYQPSPPLDIPISVFGGKSDSEVTPDELAAWQAQTSAQFSLKMFDGGHFFIEHWRSLLLNSIKRKILHFQ